MCRDEGGSVRAACLAENVRADAPPLPADASALQKAAARMRKDTAPGMDCWQAMVLEVFTLDAAKTLALVFSLIEQLSAFPQTWYLVRTHLAPKVGYSVVAHCPATRGNLLGVWAEPEGGSSW